MKVNLDGMSRRPLLVLGLLLVACGSPPGGTGFASGAGSTPSDDTTSDGAGPAGTSSSSTEGLPSGTTSTTTSTTGMNETTVAASSASSTGGPLPDFGTTTPKGCAGKIDFLFVLSNSPSMLLDEQARYLEALPVFIDTISSKFTDFDSHIMVVSTSIDNECGNCCCCPEVPDSLCDEPVYQCDAFIGSGVTRTIGKGASNKRCHFAGGHRYITRDEPDPKAAFLCAAQGGFSGGLPAPADALLDALGNPLALDCNAGFLRKDALLVVTIVSDVEDGYTSGTPASWREDLLAAKKGDADAIVFLLVTNLSDPQDRLQRLAKKLPHSALEDADVPSWVPFFTSSVSLVSDVCAVYVPQ